jgi:hypothetical protein
LEGWIELIASAIAGHHISLGQLGQARAYCGGAQAAEFAQLLNGDGLINMFLVICIEIASTEVLTATRTPVSKV